MILLRPGLLLRVEGLAAFSLSCIVYRAYGGGWGMFALLFLVPDLSMIPYVAGKRVGAACYNVVHSYTLPVALAGMGAAYGEADWIRYATIWTAHIGLDRLLGFGLKYAAAFQPTHVQRADVFRG